MRGGKRQKPNLSSDKYRVVDKQGRQVHVLYSRAVARRLVETGYAVFESSGVLRLRGRQIPFTTVAEYVYWRDHYRCRACGATSDTARLTLHHICPRAQGGQDSSDNMIVLCIECHQRLHESDTLES